MTGEPSLWRSFLFLKAPSAAPGLGNGLVEGGVVAPLQINLPQDYTLILQTEIDALKNANDDRRHANFANLACLSHALPFISKDLSLSRRVFFVRRNGFRAAGGLYFRPRLGLSHLAKCPA